MTKLRSTVAALAVSATAVILAVAVVLDRMPAPVPVALEFIKDMDAPNSLDRSIMARVSQGRRGKMQQLVQQPYKQTTLAQQNQQLQNEVHTLEKEVQTMSTAMKSMSAFHAKTPRTQALSRRPTVKTQALMGSRGLEHELEPTSPFYSTSAGDPLGYALSTEAGDDNPIADLQPGDYWKDPYERPFLHAPYPHDPSSTLAHTVTGDYASPATWGEIYHTKQSIDWCVENFPWFEDRIKCIKKVHPEGPLLG